MGLGSEIVLGGLKRGSGNGDRGDGLKGFCIREWVRGEEKLVFVMSRSLMDLYT